MSLIMHKGQQIAGGGLGVLKLTKAQYEANQTWYDSSEFLICITDLDPIESRDPKLQLLWTNQSPNASFAAQTVTLDLSNYDYVEIEYKVNDTGAARKIDKIYKNTTSVLSFLAVDNSFTFSNLYMRDCTCSNNGNMIFGAGISSRIGNTPQSTNSSIIPTRIWGGKI